MTKLLSQTTVPKSQPYGEWRGTPGAEQPVEKMICWTQLLRETEPEMVGPPRPLGPMPSIDELEQLFADLIQEESS